MVSFRKIYSLTPATFPSDPRLFYYDVLEDTSREITLNEARKFVVDNRLKSPDGFQIVSYHASLEPMMSRGRTLVEDGKSRKEKEEIRSSEAKSGILKLPEAPATLHIYYGKDGYYDTKNDTIINAKYRYVVYIPYATQTNTGLPLSPNVSNHPWLMFPGKYNAHIMITPEK